MTHDVTPSISETLSATAAVLKTLAAVTQEIEQLPLFDLTQARRDYAAIELRSAVAVLSKIEWKLRTVTNSKKENTPPCPENASTTASPEDRGKDSAVASSEAPAPRETTLSMFKD